MQTGLVGIAFRLVLTRILTMVLSVGEIIVLTGLVYHYLLLIASLVTRRTVQGHPLATRSFAIAIPAHNEELVLAKTLRTLRQQDYPQQGFDVYVVADYCTDNTAQVARDHGAVCYARNDGPRGRKAYALQWLLQQILAAGKDYDALVIFDADSQVDRGFLTAMRQALGQGHAVLQGRHVIANTEESPFSGLAAADMRLNNRLRNQAKHNLGLSCRLMGDAMCFTSAIIRQYGWPTASLGEDREYGLYLQTQGVHVGYVPQAISYGQAAPGWRAASVQRVRWYGGVREIRSKLALKLWLRGLRMGDWAALDGALELLLPPYSVLAALAVCVASIQLLWPATLWLIPLSVSGSVAMLWILFPFAGLWADGAPATVFRALLYGPFYLAWRLLIGLQAALLGKRVQWVRTKRREER